MKHPSSLLLLCALAATARPAAEGLDGLALAVANAPQLQAARLRVDAARLRVEIMTGTLRPDTFIRLDETAARLGVSITPIREALRTLRGEGVPPLA